MYRKIVGIVEAHKSFGIKFQLIVVLNIMVCVMSSASFFSLYAIGTKNCYILIFWGSVFIFSSLVLERSFRLSWYKRTLEISVYVYALLAMPLGFILMGSVTMPMVLYTNLAFFVLNLVATKTQRLIINPFMISFVFLFMLYEYYHPNYLYQVPTGAALIKYYLFVVPICQVAFVVLSLVIAKSYIGKQEMLTKKNDELESLMRIDALTGLFNKQYLNEQVKISMSFSRRMKASMAVLVIDIDFFKNYNDIYGHINGDKCLVRVAEILSKSAMRDSDIVFRFGGEEFVILLNNTGTDKAKAVAQRLKFNINNAKIEHQASKIASYLTVSIGVCTYNGEENMTPDTLLHRADSALYLAKNSGRNRCESADDSNFDEKMNSLDNLQLCNE